MPYRYLVITKEDAPFFTNTFDLENNYIEDTVVIDLINKLYTRDNHYWHKIDIDHL